MEAREKRRLSGPVPGSMDQNPHVNKGPREFTHTGNGTEQSQKRLGVPARHPSLKSNTEIAVLHSDCPLHARHRAKGFTTRLQLVTTYEVKLLDAFSFR